MIFIEVQVALKRMHALFSDHVVDSNLAGHDSHGVINAPNYIGGMAGGPAAEKWRLSERVVLQRLST